METALNIASIVFLLTLLFGVGLIAVLTWTYLARDRYAVKFPVIETLPTIALDEAREALDRLKAQYYRAGGQKRSLLGHEVQRIEMRIQYLQQRTNEDQYTYYELCKHRENAWREWKEIFDHMTSLDRGERHQAQSHVARAVRKVHALDRKVNEERHRAVARDELRLEELRAQGVLAVLDEPPDPELELEAGLAPPDTDALDEAADDVAEEQGAPEGEEAAEEQGAPEGEEAAGTETASDEAPAEPASAPEPAVAGEPDASSIEEPQPEPTSEPAPESPEPAPPAPTPEPASAPEPAAAEGEDLATESADEPSATEPAAEPTAVATPEDSAPAAEPPAAAAAEGSAPAIVPPLAPRPIDDLPPFGPPATGEMHQADFLAPEAPKSQRRYADPALSLAGVPGGQISEADLSGSSFAGVVFQGVHKYARCNMANADFRRIALPRAEQPHQFVECDFTGASFAECAIDYALFARCILSHSLWQGAVLNGVKFADCTVEGTAWDGVDLSRTVISGATLSQGDFSRAQLPPRVSAPSREGAADSEAPPEIEPPEESDPAAAAPSTKFPGDE